MEKHLHEIAQAILSLKSAILSLNPSASWAKEWVPFYSFIVAVIGAFFAVYKILKEIGIQKRLFIEGQNVKERDDIRYMLNNFFGPMKELRTESRILYNDFAIDEKNAPKKNEKRFRTLRHLSQGNRFSPQDTAILNEILELGKKQLNLIEKEGWIVQNSQLAELLGKLGAHIRTLSLAAEGKLDGMSERVENIVFPSELDAAIESEIRNLQDRYKDLLRLSNRVFTPMKLDKAQRKTISYYDQNSFEYFRETAYLDLREIYSEFKNYINLGDIILDAGCGIGRDTRYFIKQGYKVISFDASIEMVKLCRQYPFSYCLHKSFNDVDSVEEFDGVWACASLIHISPSKIEDALLRLANAIKPGGIIYFSLKIGIGKTISQGKTTYYHQENDIDIIMKKLMFQCVKKWENVSLKLSDNGNWKNYIYSKPPIA